MPVQLAQAKMGYNVASYVQKITFVLLMPDADGIFGPVLNQRPNAPLGPSDAVGRSHLNLAGPKVHMTSRNMRGF